MKYSGSHVSQLLFVLLLQVGVLAQAQVFDGFHEEDGYQGGEPAVLALSVLKGPEGWEDRWNLPKGSPSAEYVFRGEAGLKFPAITYPGGGAIQITPSGEGKFTIGRKMKKALGMKDHGAVYASFLLRVSEVKPQGTVYVLFSGNGGLGAGISDGQLMVLSRRNDGSSDQGPGQYEWVPLLQQQCLPNTTYFFVVKISDGGDGWAAEDEMTLWINPENISSEETASSQALVYSNDAPGNIAAPSGHINAVTFVTENLQGVTVTLDEIRLGPSWESVTTPPRP